MATAHPDFPGTDLVIQHFGYWPIFHDAHLLECRQTFTGNTQSTLNFILHAFQTTKEVDPDGHYIQEKDCLVNFRFDEVESLNLEGFKTSNTFFGLTFTLMQNRRDWSIFASMIIDPDLEFICSNPRVVSLTLCDAKAQAI